MLSKWIIKTSERETGSPASHLSVLRRLSGQLFWRLILALTALRTQAPNPKARAVAALVAIQTQDCGPCLGICVRMALRDGCSREFVRSVLEGRVEELEPELQTVFHLARGVFAHDPGVTDWSEQVEHELGVDVRADVALTLAFTPIYPFLKRALGVATDRCLRPEAVIEEAAR